MCVACVLGSKSTTYLALRFWLPCVPSADSALLVSQYRVYLSSFASAAVYSAGTNEIIKLTSVRDGSGFGQFLLFSTF